MTGPGLDLRGLEEELKKLGIGIVSGRQDTIITVKIKGLAGKSLVRGLQLADQLLQEKIKAVIKNCSTKIFCDPTFGPSARDPNGAEALCKTGSVIPSKGGSQHQVKVLGLLKSEKIRWERPVYAADDDDKERFDMWYKEHCCAMCLLLSLLGIIMTKATKTMTTTTTLDLQIKFLQMMHDYFPMAFAPAM